MPKMNTEERVEHVKAKLESAKEELKRRYGEAAEKIHEELQHEEESTKDSWDNLKSRL